MMKEISRTNWSKFCKTFNSANQYRQINIGIYGKRNGENHLLENSPFLGINLHKKGRIIDGIQLFAGIWDPEKVTEPVLMINEPSQIMVEKDKNGMDHLLKIRASDGAEARLVIFGERNPELSRELIERVAYSIYERRGYAPGNDMGDWLEAENILRKTEEQLA
jgi:hypothetical protein